MSALDKKSLIDYLIKTKDTQGIPIPAGLYDIECRNVHSGMVGDKVSLIVTRKSEMIETAIHRGTRIKMFSATPLNNIMSLFYSDVPIDIVKAPIARNTGEVIQYTAVTGAKGNIKEGTSKELERLADYMDDRLDSNIKKSAKLISFKGTKKFWESRGYNVANIDNTQIHHMNNCGLDCYKGETLIVAGKYDLAPVHYEMLWDIFGDGDMPNKKKMVIDNLNGMRQTLFLYDDEMLRTEQIERMSLATEQTIGRARALRLSANVYLFCNYVPRGVDKVLS